MFADVSAYLATERTLPARHETIKMFSVTLLILARGIAIFGQIAIRALVG